MKRADNCINIKIIIFGWLMIVLCSNFKNQRYIIWERNMWGRLPIFRSRRYLRGWKWKDAFLHSQIILNKTLNDLMKKNKYRQYLYIFLSTILKNMKQG